MSVWSKVSPVKHLKHVNHQALVCYNLLIKTPTLHQLSRTLAGTNPTIVRVKFPSSLCIIVPHKTVVFESEFLGLGTLSVYVSQSLICCPSCSPIVHPNSPTRGSGKGHFWPLQWEEVGTILYQSWKKKVSGKAALLNWKLKHTEQKQNNPGIMHKQIVV